MEHPVPVSKQVLKKVTIRCYAELNDFLPPANKKMDFTIMVKTPITTGEIIESIGIPMSEVDLVLVNSEPASLSQRIFENDQISLYPTFESFDIGSVNHAQKKPLRHTRFILDAHLGKLAKYLRMLGFDTLYRNDFGDDEIIDIALKENRIILSRDKLLLKSKQISHAYYVRAVEKHQQLVEIVQKFDLRKQFKSFSRCMTCNAELVSKPREEVVDLIDEDTLQIFAEFFFCPKCKKVFWKGSHFEKMENLIRKICNAEPDK